MKQPDPKPDWIHCIQHSHTDLKKQSWCGRPLNNFDLPFQNIDHAIYAVRNGDRLVPCSDCINAIAKSFKVLN